MPTFGDRSLKNLAKVHPKLRAVLDEAIKETDFTVICGHRGKAEQEAAFAAGNSKARFGQSPHNFEPACAVDVIPYPFKDWNDNEGFKRIAKAILGAAKRLGVPVRWGADWNQNGRTDDERFVDTPHFELHPWRDFTK